MKKLSLIIAVLTAILGLSQCNKPNISPFDSGRPGQSSDGQYITFTNDSGNGAKLDVNEVAAGLEFRWEYADQLHVYSCDNKNFEGDVVYNGTVTLKQEYIGEIKGQFEGFVSMDIRDYVRFYYFGSKATVSEDGSATIYLNEQEGTLSSVKEHMVARTGSIERVDGTSYQGILTVPFSVVKLDLSFFDGGSVYIDECGAHSSPTYKGLTICGTSGAFETKIDDGGTHDYEFKIDNPTSDVYLAVLPPTAKTYPDMVDVTDSVPENPEDNFMILRFSDNSASDSETKSISHIFKLLENRFYTSGIANDNNSNDDNSTDKGIEITDRVDFGFGIGEFEQDVFVGVWAKYNVGAKHLNNHHYNPESNPTTGFNSEVYSWYGDYFAWADRNKKYRGNFSPEPEWIIPPEPFPSDSIGYLWTNYEHSYKPNGSLPVSYDIFTKYVKKGTGEFSEQSFRPDDWEGDDLMLIQPEDDAAKFYQSTDFVTPSYYKWGYLKKNKKFVWTDDYYYFGISGWIAYEIKTSDEYEITDPHIFIPAAGFFNATSFSQIDYGRIRGNYMTSNRDNMVDKFLLVDFNDDVSTFHITGSSFYRRCGISVRPIMETTK